MSLSLNESLSKLEKLSPARLHQTSHRLRAALGGAEWKMALCLLATARTRSYRTLGFASVTEYADKALSLSGNKVGCLLGTARALEHLPLLSEAFQQGRIGWGKVRAIRGLATPETENAWLDFALAHRTDEVVRKVALSPRAWKRHQALQASLEGQPICTDAAVAKVLKGEPETASSAPSTGATSVIATGATTAACAHALGISSAAATANCGVTHGSSGMTNLTSGLASTYDSLGLEGLSAPCLNERSPLSASSPPNKPLLPLAPKTIRLVVEMTPDQYALYEQAESRVRAQARKHLSRAAVVTRMAESVLNNGTARARAKHQVLIHTQEDSGEAWYETQRGPLPVSTTTLRQATGQKAPLKIEPRPEVHQAQDGSETPNRTDESDARGQGGPAEADAREETNESEGDRHALSVVIKTEPHSKVTEREAEACESLAIGKSPDRDTEGRTELFNQEAGHWRRTTRSAIPNATLRQLFAQAKHQCERCGARGGRMQVHHTQPVSEGGDNGPERLKVLCEPCHGFVHEADFAHKPGWRQGREAAMSRAALRRR